MKFAPSLVPIRVGKVLRVTLRDHRYFARSFFHLFGRGRAQAISVHGNLAGARL